MQNCDIQIKGQQMVITIDLSKDCGASKSGKSRIIATTSGNITVGEGPEEVTVGLNVYREQTVQS